MYYLEDEYDTIVFKTNRKHFCCFTTKSFPNMHATCSRTFVDDREAIAFQWSLYALLKSTRDEMIRFWSRFAPALSCGYTRAGFEEAASSADEEAEFDLFVAQKLYDVTKAILQSVDGRNEDVDWIAKKVVVPHIRSDINPKILKRLSE